MSERLPRSVSPAGTRADPHKLIGTTLKDHVLFGKKSRQDISDLSKNSDLKKIVKSEKRKREGRKRHIGHGGTIQRTSQMSQIFLKDSSRPLKNSASPHRYLCVALFSRFIVSAYISFSTLSL
ncbi:hypothetical protein IscW_ISCW015951 [Ixodes scapularis]|uniref:Uncharacterized protein n=1 Tax=Ixodes scapularis TaxID=6945 RepID=B7P6J2_IXOSC|nr:hypothetical protein IscW_ISCW015951 [Ixodes scapularis]|eukprot:XP_002408872.1 hypothetical protein IscW_ISCW015951 [Ixodes scapularis]